MLFVSLQIAGYTLPYDEMSEVRERLSEVAPNLVRYDVLEPANFFALAQKLMKVEEYMCTRAYVCVCVCVCVCVHACVCVCLLLLHAQACIHLNTTMLMHVNTHTLTQSTKTQFQPEPLTVSKQKLEDFYMTDPISRASLTMAKCVTAVKEDKDLNKY